MKNLIPIFIHDQYKAGNFQGQFEAATLFMDISGFTPMSARLMREGKEGAEILEAANIPFLNSMDAAAKRVVEHAKEGAP